MGGEAHITTTIRHFLDNGANIKTSFMHWKLELTLLAASVAGGEVPRARLLLQRGADVDALDRELRTPLYCAVFHCRDMVSLLLDYGADVNAKDNMMSSPLHKLLGCNYEVVMALVEGK